MNFPYESMLIFLIIPVVINLLFRVIANIGFNKKWPPLKPFAIELGISLVINGIIALSIGFILRASGISEKFFFRPSSRDYGELAKIKNEITKITLEGDNRELDGIIITPKEEEPSALVLHFHGSDRNISHTIKNVAWLVDRGFAVMAFDYSGYGKSTGLPSMKNLVEDGRLAIRESRKIELVKDLPLVVFGQSMGGQLGIISAALELPENCLVISDSTYADPRVHTSDKMGQMGLIWLFKWVGYLMTDGEFRALDYVNKISPDRILIAHGGQDKAVLQRHGKALLESTGNKLESVFPDELGHLDIFKQEEYKSLMVSFIKEKIQSLIE